jgi:hypothetical protein
MVGEQQWNIQGPSARQSGYQHQKAQQVIVGTKFACILREGLYSYYIS